MTDKALVPDADFHGYSSSKVEDSRKDGYTNVTIGAGMEIRRGNGRLQGFYGAELMFMMGSTKTTYTYGNAYDFTNLPSQTHGTDGSSDVLEVNQVQPLAWVSEVLLVANISLQQRSPSVLNTVGALDCRAREMVLKLLSKPILQEQL